MYGRILVPVDGGPTSQKGLEEAIKLVKATGAKLKLVHVVNEVLMDPGYVPAVYYDQVIQVLREAGKKVIDAAALCAKRQDIEVERELVEAIGNRASDAIVACAKQWRADLIVMGTHGRRGLRRLALGSDAELVLRESSVPVLMVRETPEGH